MRKIFLLLTLICLIVNAMAQNQVWMVQTVPNTRLESDEIHVSDPDDYLSDSVEMQINTALCAIRDKADVFVVTLSSIGDADPKGFATELFNHWGIGDAKTDNGVLLLFVEDQHALEFETGYGAEETMTDVRCERIFKNTIVPFFRAGDYEGGLCAGVADIVTVYGGEVPVGLKTTLPNTEPEGSDLTLGEVIMGLVGLAVIVLFPLLGLIFLAAKAKTKSPFNSKETLPSTEEDGTHYVSELKTSWTGSPWDGKGCAGALMIGFSFFVFMFIAMMIVEAASPEMGVARLSLSLLMYLTWISFRHNRRVLKTAKKLALNSVNPKSVYQAAYDHKANKAAMWMAPWIGWVFYLKLKRKLKNTPDGYFCPECGQPLNATKIFMLPENHATEQRVGALKFMPYRCVNGHTYVVKEKGSQAGKFVACEKCGALAAMKTNVVTVRKATYSQRGEKQETYECQHCNSIYTSIITLPMLVHYSSSSSSSSSSGSSRSRSHSSGSSHRSGGSFGGGRSGGGGYSGRW